MAEILVLRGPTLDFDADGTPRHQTDGAVVIENSRIAWAGDFQDLPPKWSEAPVQRYSDRDLILPGFVDAHLHYPQTMMLGAYGVDLLDWLDRNTFPEEAKFGGEYAEEVAKHFCRELINHGVTSALVFSSIHTRAADALFSEAERFGLAITTGKTLMDRPETTAPFLRDDVNQAYEDCKSLIRRWHGKGRAQYAITPRFAVTSTQAQLEMAGQLMREHPELLMQTHLSESPGEIETIANLYPNAKDYTDVYDQFGLLNERSVFAHAIHLSDREIDRLKEAQASLVHCPTSNNFLGSGLMDSLGLDQQGIQVGLGCDIGGGTSFSMLHTIGEAHKVAALRGGKLDPLKAFFWATRGNAKLTDRDSELGAFDVGKSADVVVLTPENTFPLKVRAERCETLTDLLFAYMILGDDRAIAETYVAGKPLKGASQ